ncbi:MULTISPECIES: hypothetical protein [unclassified Acinetobacter]|uniref:hypothetical protein n=1 Tax=unclassified Acinetobacter TaxID=196816 RepID=UPI0015D42AAE|nr:MULTISPECIES: hypothetical protein [unclassified Acinetobacter]UUS61830.1 hypothetical protein MST17_05885 [Acinetobacter sp. YH16056_T]
MNLKVLIAVVVLIVGGLFYFVNQSNKADIERLKQAEVAHQQKLEQEKVDEAKALQLSAQRQAELEKTKALKVEQERLNGEKRAKEYEQAKQDKLTQEIKFIEDKARVGLFDPEAAKFRNIKGNCGEINAKNKVGGYIGYRRFIYDADFDTVSIEDEKDGLYNPKMMDILWDKKCP